MPPFLSRYLKRSQKRIDVIVIVGWSRQDLETATAGDWERSIFNLSSVEGQERLLVCWVAGQAALVADSVEDSEVIEVVTRLLRRFTGDPTLPPPDQVIRHRWTEDRLSLSGYSVPGVSSREEDHAVLMRAEPSEVEPRLVLAGEHTQPLYWSFLHGARLAGVQQADKIINHRNLLS